MSFSKYLICIAEAFKKTHKAFKALDIVINNAGILDDGRWELEIAINVVSRTHHTKRNFTVAEESDCALILGCFLAESRILGGGGI
jgi:NAD(P)-dependent dehydrogenase (short-subunit alcohol dehydrogenase family)